jgi:replicative DNA helicase
MSLPYIHIATAADEIISYMDKRRRGKIKSLKTKWERFNNQCMGGIEPNSIYTFAGISGSGKSAFLNTLETDLFECNPEVDFVVLSFNFEMLSSRQVGRKLSNKLNKTTQQLYSGLSSEKLSKEELDKASEEVEKIKKLPIYYVDLPGNVDDIRETIMEFSKLEFVKNKWLIITLDHTLLTKGRSGEKEREILANLQYMFMEIKKFAQNTIIQLSQMNREIESTDRLNNPSMHFPTRRDIFGGESVFQASDYVIVVHRPELLLLKVYGPAAWPVANRVYMHFLKNREGELKVLTFTNDLKYNRIEDYDPGSANPISPLLFNY